MFEFTIKKKQHRSKRTYPAHGDNILSLAARGRYSASCATTIFRKEDIHVLQSV